MKFNDETFDIVRSDFTLLRFDMTKALLEIRRVLKVNDCLIVLEAGAGGIYSSDEVIINIYDSVLPSHRDGGGAVRLHFMLPKLNFRIESSQPMALILTGEDLARGDQDWVKLKGTREMLMTKSMITEEHSQDFQKRYIEGDRSIRRRSFPRISFRRLFISSRCQLVAQHVVAFNSSQNSLLADFSLQKRDVGADTD